MNPVDVWKKNKDTKNIQNQFGWPFEIYTHGLVQLIYNDKVQK